MLFKEFGKVIGTTTTSDDNVGMILGVIIIVALLVWILFTIFSSKRRTSSPTASEETKVPDKKVKVPQDPKPNSEGITPIVPKEEDLELDEPIITPAAGKLMTIDKVPDPMYSEKVLGDGFAIEPTNGKIFSPVSGRVDSVSNSRNGVVLVTPSQHKVIMHFGLGTAKLGGKGFAIHVANGDKVKAGDTLCTMDLELVMSKADSLITPVVFVDLEKDERVVVKEEGIVTAKMPGVIVIEKGTKPE